MNFDALADAAVRKPATGGVAVRASCGGKEREADVMAQPGITE